MSEENWFTERLERHLVLTRREWAAVASLGGTDRNYRRGAVIRREKDRAQDLYIVNSGWLVSFVLLDDGSRQILRVHLAGDLVGLSCAAFTQATESLLAITDVRLTAIDKGAFRSLFESHPRLGALMFVISQAEQVQLNDRLASLGRTSGKARVAALLLDAITRLRMVQRNMGRSFVFPLTQEEIGDATGLTAVHVNRMIRSLVEEGLVSRQSNLVTIIDEERLGDIANYIDRNATIDVSWLPASAA